MTFLFAGSCASASSDYRPIQYILSLLQLCFTFALLPVFVIICFTSVRVFCLISCTLCPLSLINQDHVLNAIHLFLMVPFLCAIRRSRRSATARRKTQLPATAAESTSLPVQRRSDRRAQYKTVACRPYKVVEKMIGLLPSCATWKNSYLMETRVDSSQQHQQNVIVT